MIAKQITINYRLSGYSTDVRTYEGQDYLVVPTVMMVEGVHHGSAGPIFYSSHELSKNLESWNGRPVTINHPEEGGQPVSAAEPNQYQLRVGYVFNAYFSGNALRAEAWLNIAQLEQRSPETLEMLRNHTALDVSIGVFSDTRDEQGDWNNEDYQGVAANLRPDHLALLPNATGACSWDDGCGIRNQQNINKNEVTSMSKPTEGSEKTLLRNAMPMIKVNKDGEQSIINITVNETGFYEILQTLQRSLDRLDSEIYYHFLEEVYPDYFIYRTHNRESGESKFYKRGYSVNDSGVEMNDDAAEVRKETSFVTINSQTEGKLNRTNFPNNMNTNATPCSVDALIKNEKSTFTDADREWLANMSQEQIEKLSANLGTQAPATPQVNKGEQGPGSSEEPLKINGKSLKDAVKEILQNEANPESFIDNFFPKEIGKQMKAGLSMYRTQREKTINEIVENSSFSKEELEAFEDGQLTKLHSTVVSNAAGDYSFQSESTITANSGNIDAEEASSMLNLK